METNNIIFVGGIHGVGKGTFCKKIAKELDYVHLSASKVLKWDEICVSKSKRVINFATTQERLINNLKIIISEDKKYLLDGHFTLLDSGGKPQRIEETVFYEINPISIIVLSCVPQIIYERLSNRDCIKYDLSTLEKMQKMEISFAKEISDKLNIPLFIVNDGETTILNQLKQL